MRLLIDTCVWGGAAGELRAAGHDVVWSGDWSEDPGDAEILARAYDENRVLVTLDKDFGELAIVFGQPHCGIVRLVNLSARQQSTICLRVLAVYGTDLESGAIVTASPGRVRIRPAEGIEETD
jgi:predicted nuclease of predicted toxin-antitoxin system